MTSRRAGGKLRIGVLVGKDFDPVPRGTHDRSYPKRFRIMNNTGPRAFGWGGMFHIDVSMALKLQRLYPDLIEVDIMTGHDITASRLRRNHLNFNIFYDVVVALYKGGKAHSAHLKKLLKNPSNRIWPNFDYYDWVCTKPRYMKQCIKAGIPMIDTIFVENGLDPKKLIKQIKAKGWSHCFIKAAAYVCYGNAAIYGRTQDFIDDPSLLSRFLKENAGTTSFLVQPYTLKSDGKVFDEIRNFFIDGKWAYSVYTDGMDDNAVWEQPAGQLKDSCRLLAERAYQEILKVAKWEGKPMVPLLCRIDVGIVDDPSKPEGFRIFVNEIESEISTWLARYCPFNLCDAMAHASAKKVCELLTGLLESGRHIPDAKMVHRLTNSLQRRLRKPTY